MSKPILSNQIIKPEIQKIDFQGIDIFTKKEKLLESELFGIPLKWVLAVAGLIYFLKKMK